MLATRNLKTFFDGTIRLERVFSSTREQRKKLAPTHCAVYFPGSTIGNFKPSDAMELLARIAPLCGTGGGLLIGFDLQKEIGTLENAYNDAKGITAEFNLNLLRRINRELNGDFDLHQFKHVAAYDTMQNRIEISLESQCDQVVTISGNTFYFGRGESIITEHSHKYTVDGFVRMASTVGLSLRKQWTDQQRGLPLCILQSSIDK